MKRKMQTVSDFKLSQRSIDRLAGLHKDLVAVVNLAIQETLVDFGVIEGLRSLERQKGLVKQGKSQTLNSRHLTGHAVDLAAYICNQITWDWEPYEQIATAMKGAALHLGIPIEWGGDWKTLKDGVHFQLPFDDYPSPPKKGKLL